MAENKNLAAAVRNSFIYSLSGLILRASSVFLFPVFTLYLTKADYGILSITQSISSVLAILISVELSRGVTRFIYLKDFEARPKGQIVGNALLLIVFSNLLFCATFLLLGTYILKPVLGEIPFYPYMFFTLLSMPLTSVFDFYRSYLKSVHSGKSVFILEMLYYSGNILMNFVFVVFFGMGVMGIIYSTLIIGIVFIVYFVLYPLKEFLYRPDLKIIKPLLKYTFPLFLFILLGFILESTDRFFLNSYLGVDISGVYYIALTYATIFSAVKEAFNSAFVPWYFSNKETLTPNEVKKLFQYIFIGAGIICAAMSMFSYEVLYVLSSNPELVKAADYVPFMVMSLYIVFIGQFYNIPVLYKLKESRSLIYSNLLAVIVLIALCPITIPEFREYGAIISRMTAFAVMTAVQLYLCKKHTDVPVEVLMVTIMVIFFLGIANLNFLPFEYPYRLLIKLLIFGGFSWAYLYKLNIRYNIFAYLKKSIFKQST